MYEAPTTVTSTAPGERRWLIADGEYTPVREIILYPAGQHPHSPVVKDRPALQYVTARGSRWTGVDAYGSPVFPPRMLTAFEVRAQVQDVWAQVRA